MSTHRRTSEPQQHHPPRHQQEEPHHQSDINVTGTGFNQAGSRTSGDGHNSTNRASSTDNSSSTDGSSTNTTTNNNNHDTVNENPFNQHYYLHGTDKLCSSTPRTPSLVELTRYSSRRHHHYPPPHPQQLPEQHPHRRQRYVDQRSTDLAARIVQPCDDLHGPHPDKQRRYSIDPFPPTNCDAIFEENILTHDVKQQDAPTQANANFSVPNSDGSIHAPVPVLSGHEQSPHSYADCTPIPVQSMDFDETNESFPDVLSEQRAYSNASPAQAQANTQPEVQPQVHIQGQGQGQDQPTAHEQADVQLQEQAQAQGMAHAPDQPRASPQLSSPIAQQHGEAQGQPPSSSSQMGEKLPSIVSIDQLYANYQRVVGDIDTLLDQPMELDGMAPANGQRAVCVGEDAFPQDPSHHENGAFDRHRFETATSRAFAPPHNDASRANLSAHPHQRRGKQFDVVAKRHSLNVARRNSSARDSGSHDSQPLPSGSPCASTRRTRAVNPDSVRSAAGSGRSSNNIFATPKRTSASRSRPRSQSMPSPSASVTRSTRRSNAKPKSKTAEGNNCNKNGNTANHPSTPDIVKPLSAYNFFFAEERGRIVDGTDNIPREHELHRVRKERLLWHHVNKDRKRRRIHRKTHGKISFTTLSKVIGKRWRDLPAREKDFFRDVARADLERYQEQLQSTKVDL